MIFPRFRIFHWDFDCAPVVWKDVLVPLSLDCQFRPSTSSSGVLFYQHILISRSLWGDPLDFTYSRDLVSSEIKWFLGFWLTTRLVIATTMVLIMKARNHRFFRRFSSTTAISVLPLRYYHIFPVNGSMWWSYDDIMVVNMVTIKVIWWSTLWGFSQTLTNQNKKELSSEQISWWVIWISPHIFSCELLQPLIFPKELLPKKMSVFFL